ncbi:cyclic-phosphate processing receiver domain-containing protein [Thalassorhabdus alkalitolerans]|uniref:Cyclic-phosphate processing receiver domain-containing protein n=1 Tax=Thalassorhabdus alkalitolerans TaxID=2282697 RepID=A0ABW0YHI7_9BACI
MNKRLNVFLDDVRQCPEEHVLAKTADDCIELIREGNPITHLSLDHDLGSKEKNGYAVVLHMIEQGVYAQRITIHSANASEGKKMYKRLLEAQKDGNMPREIKVVHRPLPL